MLSKKYYYYQVFGLVVRSELALPGLKRAASQNFDVTIELAMIDFPVTKAEQVKFQFGPVEQIFGWHRLGTYRIVGASRIEIDPEPDAEIQMLALPLFGRVFATLLHLRGNLVLHASAVSLDDKGIALLGDKKAGKSTTASAFVKAGHSLLSDDIVSLHFDEGGVLMVQQAIPEIKLWDDAANAVELEAVNAGYIFNTTKSKRQLTSGFCDRPVPMRAIYHLDRRDEACITPLNHADAFKMLLRFSYLSEFGFDLFSPEKASHHMKLCAQVAGLLPIARLTVPTGLERLGEVVACVTEGLC